MLMAADYRPVLPLAATAVVGCSRLLLAAACSWLQLRLTKQLPWLLQLLVPLLLLLLLLLLLRPLLLLVQPCVAAARDAAPLVA